MSDEKSQQEPTMEEILASIRRIISENDDGEGKDAPKAAAPAEAAPSPGAPPEGAPARAGEVEEEEEILELTEVVSLGPAEGEPGETAASRNEETFGEDGAGADKDEDVVMEDSPAVAPARRAGDSEPLVSAATAAASTAALGALARALDRDGGAVGNIALGHGNTLEDLVRDMIRPMLREWLDQNLPRLVERLVKKEIERMVRRAEDDI